MKSSNVANSRPDISVILPVYNAEAYLAEALDSLLVQSFENFELLIHDDGSTDNSLKIIQELAARDERIVVTTAPNAGIVESLNRMLNNARAPLIARMDADDVCMPDRLEKQAAFLAANPDHVLVGGAWMEIDGAGRMLTKHHPFLEHEVIDQKMIRGQNGICHPTVLMRADIVRKLGGYRETYIYAEDLDLWLRLAEVGKIANLADSVISYRVHDTSISASKAEAQKDAAHRACKDACKRRGEEAPFLYQEWRMSKDRRSRCRYYVRYGWRGWHNGYKGTWRHYAIKSVLTYPLSVEAWKLLIFGAIRSPPRSKTK